MAKKGRIDIPFLKIVYFDEDAATDLIYMKNKGKIIESMIDNKKTDSEIKGNIESEFGTKNNLLSLLGIKFGAGVNASIARGSEHLINQAITNTVLTDYLELSTATDKITKFPKASVKPYENSLSYVKIITPYMIMTEGKMDIGGVNINIPLIDEAIKKGKGYYELVLTDSDNKNSVLRFNLTSFKNSYSLPDLIKMSLTYHAIKVGSIELSSLNIENEFSFSDKQYIDGTKLADETFIMDDNKVDVFDVILAGVAND